MSFNTYTVAGALIAADLVNGDPADGPALAALLAAYEVWLPAVTPPMAAQINAWARPLRGVFAAGDPAQRANRADELLVAASCTPRLVSHDGLPHHLHYAPRAASPPARVRALTAAGLAQVIADGEGHRLGQCQREACTEVFVDVSRNALRRFCSVRCANVVNVRRHRARRRGTAG
ncbi:MAG: CGNR zinc finger domain-containing protein [Actinomycetota bacterium]|nr:CGNR zinc finger domain-containing protein [Actinomycetota bacterium]